MVMIASKKTKKTACTPTHFTLAMAAKVGFRSSLPVDNVPPPAIWSRIGNVAAGAVRMEISRATLMANLASIGLERALITGAELHVCPREGSTRTVADCFAAVERLSESHAFVIHSTLMICQSLKAWQALHFTTLPKGELEHGARNRPCAFLSLTPLLAQQSLACTGSLIISIDRGAADLWEDLDVHFVPCSVSSVSVMPTFLETAVGQVSMVSTAPQGSPRPRGSSSTYDARLCLSGPVTGLWFESDSLPKAVRISWTQEAAGEEVTLHALRERGIIPAPHGFQVSFAAFTPMDTHKFPCATEFLFADSGEPEFRHSGCIKNAALFDGSSDISLCLEYDDCDTVPDHVPVYQCSLNVFGTYFYEDGKGSHGFAYCP